MTYSDPRDSISLDYLINTHSDQISEFETVVEVGCNELRIERLCSILTDSKGIKIYWRKFNTLASQLKTHREVCNLKEKYIQVYLGPSIDETGEF